MLVVVLGTRDRVENKGSTLWTSGSHLRAASVSPVLQARPGTGWDYWASSLGLRVLPPALGREVLRDSSTAISLTLLSSLWHLLAPEHCPGGACGSLGFLILSHR